MRGKHGAPQKSVCRRSAHEFWERLLSSRTPVVFRCVFTSVVKFFLIPSKFHGGCRANRSQRSRSRSTPGKLMVPHNLAARALTLGAAFAFIVGLTGAGLAAALVGETKQVSLQQKAPSTTDTLKVLYRRPATIPFPKDNPYTPEKAALGKKLYFDTRLSVSAAQSCASCHSPSYGWGDGLAVGIGNGMHKLGRHS